MKVCLSVCFMAIDIILDDIRVESFSIVLKSDRTQVICPQV